MANFEKAVAFVLTNEGGFVDNANDSGGVTNFGISLRFLKQIPVERLRKYGIFRADETLSVQDIQDLTEGQAKLIYKGEFWDCQPFEQNLSQLIANYLFDMVVLHGANQAIKLLQRAFWAFSWRKDALADDGIFGEKTLNAIYRLMINSEEEPHFISVLMAERAGFMRLLCVENPKNKEFLDGWLSRCYRI